VKELSKREKIIVSVVAVVLVGFLVNRFVVEPQSKKMKQLRKELASLSEQTAGIGPKLAEFNRLKSDLVKKKRQIAELEQALFQTADMAEIIQEVSKQARTRGLQIQEAQTQKSMLLSTRGSKPGDIYQLFLNLKIRGWYKQLVGFLGDLEQQPFYIRVAELNMDRREKRSALLDIQLKLEIVVRS
jgi:Tfp pilus assembly protein PilO